jgi:hypothetical protein
MNNSLHRLWGVESIEKSPGKSELKEGPPSPSSAANLLRRPYPRESPRGPFSPRPFLGINESK